MVKVEVLCEVRIVRGTLCMTILEMLDRARIFYEDVIENNGIQEGREGIRRHEHAL